MTKPLQAIGDAIDETEAQQLAARATWAGPEKSQPHTYTVQGTPHIILHVHRTPYPTYTLYTTGAAKGEGQRLSESERTREERSVRIARVSDVASDTMTSTEMHAKLLVDAMRAYQLFLAPSSPS